MDYVKVLEQHKKLMRHGNEWWPDFFYHFTDVHNAVGIIESGWIYSRDKAEAENLMINDNASRVVIGMTGSDKKIYGRLYFRPLTPTQYHNEGYKPYDVRNKDIDASCPVPVFFLLSVEKTMALENTKFAEKGISGNRNHIQSGVKAFSKLNFDKIYHDGRYNPQTDGDLKEYRQSEIVREGGFPVPKLVRAIVCRSNAEKETLLYLIRKYSLRLYESYKKIIMYKPSKRMFYGNGVFIKEVSFANWTIFLELNSAYLRNKNNSENEVLFEVRIEVTCLSKYGQQLSLCSGMAKMNYNTVENIEMPIESTKECASVLVKVMFDEAVMYENEIDILEDEIL